jgi:hypothetical protein
MAPETEFSGLVERKIFIVVGVTNRGAVAIFALDDRMGGGSDQLRVFFMTFDA